MRLNVTIALSVSDANRIEKKMGRTPGQGRGPYVERRFGGKGGTTPIHGPTRRGSAGS
jgi:hypothetical protein